MVSICILTFLLMFMQIVDSDDQTDIQKLLKRIESLEVTQQTLLETIGNHRAEIQQLHFENAKQQEKIDRLATQRESSPLQKRISGIIIFIIHRCITTLQKI